MTIRDRVRNWLGIERVISTVEDSRFLALRDSQELRTQLVEAVGLLLKIAETQGRLLQLLEPVAPRLRAGRVPAPDWDQVQMQTLKEFQDEV